MRPIVSNSLHRCVSCPLGAYDFETKEGQRRQNRHSGSQGLGQPKLLLSKCVWCQVIYNAPGVQNQPIHKLSDLTRTRLLAKGQMVSPSPLHGAGSRQLSSLEIGQTVGPESLYVKIPFSTQGRGEAGDWRLESTHLSPFFL